MLAFREMQTLFSNSITCIYIYIAAAILSHLFYADHIEHIKLAAGIDHVGIGSDFDGIDK